MDIRRNPQCNNQNGSRYFQMFRSQGVEVRSGGLSPDEFHQYKPSEKSTVLKPLLILEQLRITLKVLPIVSLGPTSNLYFLRIQPQWRVTFPVKHIYSVQSLICFPHQQITKSCNLSFTSSSFLISLPLAHYLSIV